MRASTEVFLGRKKCPVQGSVTSRLVDPRRSRPRLAMLAFRTGACSNSHKTAAFAPCRAESVYALLDKFKKLPFGSFSNLPSTGIEPVTFPMSRERATAAPTGLKTAYILLISLRENQFAVFDF